MRSRLLPYPLLSLFLLLVWLLLVNDFSPGHWLLGAFLGWGIAWLVRPFWPATPALRSPRRLLGFVALVLGDIVVANFQVARRILGPRFALRPAFVEVPMDLDDQMLLTVLACVVSLTPGTVSADLSADHRTLLVHGLDVDDEAALIQSIKQRYEAPLKEIFACSTR
ncbi:Na+/H+ antiporter subunit E [Pseudomonas sp. NW5]|uniref:Na+/H+ antiporter subunit E n=1 Tax=Pseudomonas sp. NW5 TaxID=2934934 RepID=UPI002021FA85|nr:Na+/H+ antiporter subunit E [Pseudomonas sp. NW5]MCL7462042.1 Na+/H+ antiporter subunit E [Pseudomonas sp. NW5]